jgi:fatty-acyl-CoA synthase
MVTDRAFEHLNDLLVRSLRAHSATTLVVEADGTSWTGAQLEVAIARCAAVLDRLDLRFGDRVALLSGNRIEVLFVQQAVAALGGVFVPLHPLGSPADFAHILDDAGPTHVVVDGARIDEISEAVRIAGSSARVLTIGGGGPDDLQVLMSAETTTVLEPRPTDPEAICRIVYTGGTTGIPKASQVSYRSMSTMYGIELADWQWPDEVRNLLVAPLSHAGGVCFVPTVAQGGTLYVQQSFDAGEFLAAVERHRITCALLVPTMISAILDHPRLREHDTSSLATVFYGASPISPQRLRDAIAWFGPIFFQFYGQAEVPTTVCVMRREEHDVTSDDRMASCGRPVAEADVRLVDVDGMEVPDGQPGELCVRGPLLMSGYLNRPEDTAHAMRGGWLHTGDVAVRDADGFLRIVDRAKDLVITGGFNVYPRNVEDALEEHPAVAAASVFGVPDDYWGEILVAAVELRDPSVTVEELKAHVRERKGPVQTPKRIEIVERIPLTQVGKRDKKALRRTFVQQETPETSGDKR